MCALTIAAGVESLRISFQASGVALSVKVGEVVEDKERIRVAILKVLELMIIAFQESFYWSQFDFFSEIMSAATIKSVGAHIADDRFEVAFEEERICLLYTSPSPRDQRGSRMPSSA